MKQMNTIILENFSDSLQKTDVLNHTNLKQKMYINNSKIKMEKNEKR